MIGLSPPSLSVEREQVPRTERQVTLVLDGEISEAELLDLVDMLERVALKGTRRVVLDLTDVTHFDFRGVKKLIARAEKLRALGGDLRLCGLSPYVHAIFRSAGAHDAFEYHSTAEQARDSFSRRDL